MHETALIAHLLRRVERELAAAGASRVTALRLKVGALAGVEPALLESAYRDLSPGTPAEGARLDLELVPLLASCEDCGRGFEVERFRFHCPACGSGRTRIVAGEHVILEEIVVAGWQSLGAPS